MFLGAFGGGDRLRLQRQQLVVAASAHFLKTHQDPHTIAMTMGNDQYGAISNAH